MTSFIEKIIFYCSLAYQVNFRLEDLDLFYKCITKMLGFIELLQKSINIIVPPHLCSVILVLPLTWVIWQFYVLQDFKLYILKCWGIPHTATIPTVSTAIVYFPKHYKLVCYILVIISTCICCVLPNMYTQCVLQEHLKYLIQEI